MPKIKSRGEGKEGLKPEAAHPLAASPGQSLQSQPGHVCLTNRVRRDELVTLGFLDSLAQRFVSSLIFFWGRGGEGTLIPFPSSLLCQLCAAHALSVQQHVLQSSAGC